MKRIFTTIIFLAFSILPACISVESVEVKEHANQNSNITNYVKSSIRYNPKMEQSWRTVSFTLNACDGDETPEQINKLVFKELIKKHGDLRCGIYAITDVLNTAFINENIGWKQPVDPVICKRLEEDIHKAIKESYNYNFKS